MISKVRSSYNIPFLERKIQFFLEFIDYTYRSYIKLYLKFSFYIFPFLSVFISFQVTYILWSVSLLVLYQVFDVDRSTIGFSREFWC